MHISTLGILEQLPGLPHLPGYPYHVLPLPNMESSPPCNVNTQHNADYHYHWNFNSVEGG